MHRRGLLLSSTGLLLGLAVAARAQESVPTPPPDAVVAAICRSDFGGAFAAVRVWRGPDQSIGVLELQPDVTRFDHAPTVFFDAQGTPLLSIPETPVEPGSAEAEAWTARRQAVLDRLQSGESLTCRPYVDLPASAGTGDGTGR